jgi:hypothetical protein
MRVLAFDTTGPILTAGAADGVCVLGRKDSRADRNRGNLLDQLIDALLSDVGWSRSDVEGIGLTTGPGSLTANRLGWATAAGWAQAAGIPLAGWTVPEVHRRHLGKDLAGATCCIHYRGDTFLLYDLERIGSAPAVVHLAGDAYASTPPSFLTGPGIIGHRESWVSYCGPQTRVASESSAFIGGDTLALWAAEDLLNTKSLSLVNSPLEYGLPPDFKKLASA